MGILGDVKLVKRTRQVAIGLTSEGEEVTVTVTAPPLQLAAKLQKQIDAPQPPPLLNDRGEVRFQTHPKTGEVLKENGKLLPMLNHQDEQYLTELESVSNARTIAMIFACTKFPGESDLVQNGQSDVAFQFARWKELEDAGCDVGGFTRLAKACVELSAPMSKSEVEDARRALGTDKETQAQRKEELGKKAPEGKSG